MISSSSEILLLLLRAALGNEGAGGRLEGLDLGSVSGEVWKEVIDLAFEQGIAAIAVDGLQRSLELRAYSLEKVGGERLERGFAHDNDTLRYDNDNIMGLDSLDSPELEELKYEWFGGVFAREEDYGRQMEAIRSLVGLWARNGLVTYALKGVAFAQYYPVPEHRYSCDFDCNVRGADGAPAWAEADRIARESGIEVDGSMNKHSRFVAGDSHSLRPFDRLRTSEAQGKLGSGQVPVENHRHVVSVNGSRQGKRFDAYLQGLLTPEERLLPDLPLYSPCWLFNALFCIAHARTHFIEEEGIALKHVLDWVLIRKAPGAARWREQFEKDIDRFGLRKFFDALDEVADVLEASPTKTITKTKTGVEAGSGGRLTESQRLMLEDILAPKQVRHFESRFLAHLNILRMLWANRWKFRLYSDTTFIATVFRYVYGHWFDRDGGRG